MGDTATDSANLAALGELGLDVLAEVVREGEATVRAQFDAANSADQRAMAWISILVSVCTASLGAATWLALEGEQIAVAGVALFFTACLFFAVFKAVGAVRPSEFQLPGNEPVNWLPENWSGDHDLRQARIEQAICLQHQIDQNYKWTDRAGSSLRFSIDLTIWSILICAIALAAITLAKFLG